MRARALPVIAALLLHSAHAADPSAGLVGHWDFEDTSEGVLRDRSGNERHGRIHGAPRPVAGVAGQALRFVEVGDFIQFEGAVVPAGDFTIALWLNCDDTEKQFFLGQYLYQHPERLDLAVREGCVRIQIDEIVDSEPLVQARRWHHLAYTRSGSDLKVYLDGELITRAELPGAVIQSDPLILGKIVVPGRDDFRFTGIMDELRIWAGALSADSIRALSETKRPRSEPMAAVQAVSADELPQTHPCIVPARIQKSQIFLPTGAGKCQDGSIEMSAANGSCPGSRSRHLSPCPECR